MTDVPNIVGDRTMIHRVRSRPAAGRNDLKSPIIRSYPLVDCLAWQAVTALSAAAGIS